MCSNFGKKKYKYQENVDDVDGSITEFARSLDSFVEAAEMFMTYVAADGINDSKDTSGKAKQLQDQYHRRQKELDDRRKDALEDNLRLLHKLSGKKKIKKDISIEENENNLRLEKYMNEPRPYPHVIHFVEDGDWEKVQNKKRENEQEHLRKEIKSLNDELKASLETIKQLKTENQIKISENKYLHVNHDSLKDEVQSLKKKELQNVQDTLVPKQYSAHQQESREKVISKELNQIEILEKENEKLKREKEAMREEIGRLNAEVLKLTEELRKVERSKQVSEKECQEKRQEMKIRNTEINNLKEDLKKMGNDKKLFEQELICLRETNESFNKEDKESKSKILQLRKEISSLKMAVQTKVDDNKDLLLRIDSLEIGHEKETERLQNEIEKLKRDNDGIQIEKSRINAERLTLKTEAQNYQANTHMREDEKNRLVRKIQALEKEIKEKELENEINTDKIKTLKEELKNNLTTIKEETKISKQVEGEREALRRDNKKMQQLLSDQKTELEKQKEELEIRLADLHSENDKTIDELIKQQEKVQNEVLETNTKLKKSICDLKNLLSRTKDENSELNLQISKLVEQGKKYEMEQTSLKEADEGNTRRIENLEHKLQEASHEIKHTNEKYIQTNESNKIEIEKLQTEIKGLQNDNRLLDSELKAMRQKTVDLQTTLNTQSESNDATRRELMNDIEMLRGKQSEREKAIASLRLEKGELEQMYDTVKQELDLLKSAKTMRIQLYHHSRTSLMSNVQTELKASLKKLMDDESFELNFVECGNEDEIDPNEPLLILCISVSRLGTDAKNAVQALSLTSKMALLVFHHKDGHALPNQDSEHVLTGQEFRRLGGIYDFGFLSSKGIYSCEMNDTNLKRMVQFLDKEGTRF